MKIHKVGIIGCGYIGAVHAECLRRMVNTEVVAIAEEGKELTQEKAAQLNIPKAYGQWRELIEDPQVEVVHNCTPNYLHYEINKAVLEIGKPVLSEKPLALNTEQSGELAELAESKGIPTDINFNYRYYPLTQHCHYLLKQGGVGKIYSVLGYYIQDWLALETDYNWRMQKEFAGDSRTVADIGSHWCDLVQFVTGLRIEEVIADVATFMTIRKKARGRVETFSKAVSGLDVEYDEIPIDTEDYGSVLLRFENGVKGAFTTSNVFHGRKNYIAVDLYGSKQSLSWNNEYPNDLWIGHRERANELLLKNPLLMDNPSAKLARYPAGHNEGYDSAPMNLFMDFYKKIEQPHRQDCPGIADFRTGHRLMQLCEAILESARERRWVKVPK